MAVAEGASGRGSDDPVLAGALAELESEGAFETSDLATPDASQTTGDASAASASALPATTGDDGNGPTTDVPAGDPAVPAPDPFEGTQPFTYSVNGVEKTLDGVYRVPGEGLLVPEDKVSSLQQLAERAETLDHVTRQFATQHATLERLGSWTTQDADGKEQTFTGAQGIAALRTDFATQQAAFNTLAGVFLDPTQAGALVDVVEGPNGPQIVWNQQAIQTLVARSEQSEQIARYKTKEALSELAQPPAPKASAPDYAAQAPGVISSAAKASGLDASGLTAKDNQYLASLLPRFVRAVTEDDRRMNPSLQVGGPIVDAAFTQVLKDRVEMVTAAKQTAAASEKAGKFNAGQQKGRQPAAAAPKAPAAPKAETNTRPHRADWNTPLETALAEMAILR